MIQLEIPDSLLEQARKLAAAEGTTVRALVEEGLRRVLEDRQKAAGRFKLRRASVGGRGLQAGMAGCSWEQIRDLAYEGRGA